MKGTISETCEDEIIDSSKKIRNKYEHAFSLTHDSIIIILKDSRKIIDVNSNACLLYGYNREELLNKKIEDVSIYQNEQVNKINLIVDEDSVYRSISTHRSKKNKKFVVEINAKLDTIDSTQIVVLFIKPVTKERQRDVDLLYRLNFEKLTAEISSTLLMSDKNDANSSIEFALQKVGEFIEADRCMVFQTSEDLQTVSITHEWCVFDHHKCVHKYQNYSIDRIPYWFKKLSEHDNLIITNTSKLPHDAWNEKNMLQRDGVKSMIAVPLSSSNILIGFLVFQNLTLKKDWNIGDANLLKIIAELITHAIIQQYEDLARKSVEDEMRKLTNAVEQSANSVVITDTDGNIEYVNPAFTKITGYTFGEVIGKNPRILKSGNQEEQVYKDLWNTISNGNQWVGRFQNIKKNGEVFWENVTISPIKNMGGEITNYLAIKEDITEKIKVENQLAVAQKMESIGQLAAGIAHEINTPMQYVGDNTSFLKEAFESVNNFINSISDNADENSTFNLSSEIKKLKDEIDLEFLVEEIPNALDQSKIGIDRVTKIVKAMKDFAHPGEKDKSFHDINHGIEVTATISKNEWKYVADLELNLKPDLPNVYCLQDELNQVILNMIVNAAHAIEKVAEREDRKGIIKISTDADDQFVHITISDSGEGISQENLHKIFNPFFTTKEVGKGTGQGLSIAHDIIVNKHNGQLDVNSKVGKGTEFHIKLPFGNE